MTTNKPSTKNQMLVLSSRRGLVKINCFGHERDYMAGLARMFREGRRKHGEPRKSLADMRRRAAERYL